MNRPRPHRGTLVICAALALVLVLCAVVASSSPIVAFALMPLIAGLLAIEVDRRGELLAERIVRLGGRLVPERARVDCVDEWIDHVLAADEGGLHPVWEAVQIALLAAPRIAGRRFLGRYLLGLMTAIQNIVWREQVDSPIQASKAMFRFWALAMVPVLAIPGGRRLKLPGWMIYGSAFLVQYALLFVNCGSLEMAIVVRCASQICLVVAAYALYAMGEPILRLASRLLDIPAPGE